MDILQTVREIGLFETANNLAKVSDSEEVWEKVCYDLPLPSESIHSAMDDMVSWITALGKSKYMFLSPENAIIERIADRDPVGSEAIVTIASDLTSESRDRIKANLTKKMRISTLDEPFFASLYPASSLIVACGYMAGGRAMVLPETYRMVEHYNRKGFVKMVFFAYESLPEFIRYDEWVEIDAGIFSAIWEGGRI